MVYPMPLFSDLLHDMEKIHVVLFLGYDNWILGGGDNGTSQRNFGVYYTIRPV